ncbi:MULTISPECIES: GMC family oxidoreductase N-terminal domain-containing protein [unclassified Chelatococcus]|uniref:GMC family oxidoreductase n=1 Tax=unclassified Chelatococcus TaxID=2638111 RepID=UPI001BCCB849|nr:MULTISPECIES: GMC family oxidoreductase N-terminal domain-containing protein [unclassified Chelatococcus]CAH1654769.1 GMC type oxidoreductase [Hyphomicrobiales bacterium]MBS7742745.1 GMC family oxidoreductase N-terminal domain-containing protein [Chelatococcus sp. HY11]MBX3542137.1 GMC family oxidoreductase N-terminal domain-containing protein [Chelatococcus sp.]MCO5075648.1 GMC family oxidoreductase N-terminal domain-containing protein [Chelatococcus sp.]CAH1695053.1 GMC type oxidoreductas
MDVFDYVIIGGGSAGCVIANRLVTAGASVCVLEAGPVDSNFFIHMPVGFVKTLFNPSLIWQFYSEPSEGSGGRKLYAPQGKTLGGSSSVNGMVYVRGQANDYNAWAQSGNRGWGYADVLPYFRRIESRMAPHDPNYRGSKGLLPVTDPDWRHPLCEAFIAGAQSIGLPRNADYNGATQEGTGYYQRTIAGSRRISAARAYLYPVMKKPNIRVLTDAQASSLILDGKRVVGVSYRRGGVASEVRARREVIVSAGAINTPRLLQLSGIGNPDVLTRAGVTVRHALNGVGENLSDHYSPRLVASVKNIGTINGLVKGPRLMSEFLRWSLRKPSVLALSAAVCYAFGRSDPALDAPDYTIIFTPASYKDGQLGVLDDYPGITAGAWQMRPESTGYVHITSADVNTAPTIQPNYLAAEKDRRVLLHAIRSARRILQSQPMAAYYDAERLPGASLQTDDELLDFARRYGSSTYHLAGSCRMGPSTARNTVVDDQLRVHGLENLRIADSSVIPAMVSANTYATALLIGEKAADFILGREALADAA